MTKPKLKSVTKDKKKKVLKSRKNVKIVKRKKEAQTKSPEKVELFENLTPEMKDNMTKSDPKKQVNHAFFIQTTHGYFVDKSHTGFTKDVKSHTMEESGKRRKIEDPCKQALAEIQSMRPIVVGGPDFEEGEKRIKIEDSCKQALAEIQSMRPIVVGGSGYDEGSQSMKKEDEFFDAVDATLEEGEHIEEDKEEELLALELKLEECVSVYQVKGLNMLPPDKTTYKTLDITNAERQLVLDWIYLHTDEERVRIEGVIKVMNPFRSFIFENYGKHIAKDSTTTFALHASPRVEEIMANGYDLSLAKKGSAGSGIYFCKNLVNISKYSYENHHCSRHLNQECNLCGRLCLLNSVIVGKPLNLIQHRQEVYHGFTHFDSVSSVGGGISDFDFSEIVVYKTELVDICYAVKYYIV